MADFSKPDNNSLYTSFAQEIRDAIASVAKMFNGTTDSNIPDGAIRWNAGSGKFEIYDSSTSTWSDLASQYNINVQQLQGNTPSDFAAASHVGSGGTAHANATTSTAGFMSSSDKAKLDNATNSATASTIMMRDSSGRAKVAAPSAADDIARKQEVDTVQSNLDAHKTSGDHDSRYVLGSGGTYTGTFDFSVLKANGSDVLSVGDNFFGAGGVRIKVTSTMTLAINWGTITLPGSNSTTEPLTVGVSEFYYVAISTDTASFRQYINITDKDAANDTVTFQNISLNTDVTFSYLVIGRAD